MLLKVGYLLCTLLVCDLRLVSSWSCLWNNSRPYRYFGTKTPYNMLKRDIRDSLVKQKDCEPVSIWGIMKNGQSYPGQEGKDMGDMTVLKFFIPSPNEDANSSLCAQDVENLHNWSAGSLNVYYDMEIKLTDEGSQELEGIGQRLKQAFPQILSHLDGDDYSFRSTGGRSEEESIKSLIKGIGNEQLSIESSKDGYDTIKSFASCAQYWNYLNLTNTSYIEIHNYLMSPEYQAFKDRFQRRLGIEETLTDVDIEGIWNLCRFMSSGIHNQFSPWCALFNTEDLQVLEYKEDLEYYYKYGYGAPFTHLLGQLALAEILTSFRDVKEGKGKKIHAYVTDDIMLNMGYTGLSLFRDKVPLSGLHRDPDRKWRTSKFSIFSNNLFAVLNKCGKGNTNEDFNVVFYLNEEPLTSICNKSVCTWNEFEDKMRDFVNIDLHSFCEPMV